MTSFKMFQSLEQKKQATPLRDWISSRHLKGPETEPVTLSRSRIYIMPNKHGVVFSLVLFVMLFGSINYNNSLGLALTFLLASVAMISILHTHKNLNQLLVRSGTSTSVIAGQPAHFEVRLTAPASMSKLSIQVINEHGSDQADIPYAQTVSLILNQPTSQRGPVQLARFRVETTYPLGIIRAWSWVELNATALAYPVPEKNAPKVGFGKSDDDAQSISDNLFEDFYGFREYHPGDSPKHLYWKKMATNDLLLAKQFSDGEVSEDWLDWDSVKHLPLEQALSRLTRWVLVCHNTGMRYGLKLESQSVKPGSGDTHKHQCLSLLAKFRLPQSARDDSK